MQKVTRQSKVYAKIGPEISTLVSVETLLITQLEQFSME